MVNPVLAISERSSLRSRSATSMPSPRARESLSVVKHRVADSSPRSYVVTGKVGSSHPCAMLCAADSSPTLVPSVLSPALAAPLVIPGCPSPLEHQPFPPPMPTLGSPVVSILLPCPYEASTERCAQRRWGSSIPRLSTRRRSYGPFVADRSSVSSMEGSTTIESAEGKGRGGMKGSSLAE